MKIEHNSKKVIHDVIHRDDVGGFINLGPINGAHVFGIGKHVSGKKIDTLTMLLSPNFYGPKVNEYPTGCYEFSKYEINTVRAVAYVLNEWCNYIDEKHYSISGITHKMKF